MRGRYPQAEVLRISAREGQGLDRWYAAISAEPGSQSPPEVDYDVYAEGEALMGWLNGTARHQAAEPMDGNQLLFELAGHIRRRMSADSIEIAHLKMTLTADGDARHPVVLSLVSTAREPELSGALEQRVSGGELVINLRAEAPPDALRLAVEGALAAGVASGLIAVVRQLEHFRPGPPKPTHRVDSV